MHSKNSPEVVGGNTKTPTCRSRNWTFTSFEKVAPVFDDKKFKFLAYGKEICPTTQKLHYQGFACMKESMTLGSMKKALGKSIHLEIMKGNLEDNIKYCSKDGNYEEFGIKPQQGARKDLEALKNNILEGKRVDEIVLENPMLYHQYGRTLNKIEDIVLRKKHRNWMTLGIWYYGETGSGKSHKAFENYNSETHYVVPNDCGWWDGYCGQETVIINDFRGEIKYNELLQIVDKWPFTVKRRGREPVPFLAKRVLITSSLEPKQIFKHREEEDKLEQLLRRFEIIKISK